MSCTHCQGPAPTAPRVAVVIPSYKVRGHILQVLKRVGPEVDTIYVVDDCCPEQSGEFVRTNTTDPRVRVLRHEVNQGVGGAVLTGVAAAIDEGLDIVVKIDGDGQMDPSLLPLFVQPIADGIADVTKGNRFYNPDDVRSMPMVRLVGNAALSFLTKLSSGYWNVFDPTNGYIAWDTRLLAKLPRAKVDKRYFFESDMLFRAGLLRAKVLDVPMTAVYGDEVSGLNIRKILLPFLLRNLRNFFKRVLYNYFLRDFNVASLELVVGTALALFGLVYGTAHWGTGGADPASPGRVMLAAFPLLTGTILLVSVVNYDTQQTPREPISPRLRAARRSPDSTSQVA